MPIDYSISKPTAGTSRSTSPTEVEILTDVSDTIADVGSRLDTLEGGAFDGVLLTIDPRVGGGAATWPAANRCAFVRLRDGGPINAVGFEVAVSSGNVSVAAYSNTGTGRAAAPGPRLATSGSVACPAAGFATVALGSTISVEAGDWLALSVDNVTASIVRNTAGSANLVAGLAGYQASAFPCPTTPTIGGTSIIPVLLGLSV